MGLLNLLTNWWNSPDSVSPGDSRPPPTPAPAPVSTAEEEEKRAEQERAAAEAARARAPASAVSARPHAPQADIPAAKEDYYVGKSIIKQAAQICALAGWPVGTIAGGIAGAATYYLNTPKEKREGLKFYAKMFAAAVVCAGLGSIPGPAGYLSLGAALGATETVAKHGHEFVNGKRAEFAYKMATRALGNTLCSAVGGTVTKVVRTAVAVTSGAVVVAGSLLAGVGSGISYLYKSVKNRSFKGDHLKEAKGRMGRVGEISTRFMRNIGSSLNEKIPEPRQRADIELRSGDKVLAAAGKGVDSSVVDASAARSGTGTGTRSESGSGRLRGV